MKSLMTYGLQTESKQAPYSSVEYQKVGADGNVYGIVREGTKYYVKTAPNKKNLISEDFSYIGGFRNRNEYAYDSFAKAQKNFELKMMSLKEAYEAKDYSVSTWDLDKKENIVIEATDKMRDEILREKQIMSNASRIFEGKEIECASQPFCEKPGAEYGDNEKENIKKEKLSEPKEQKVPKGLEPTKMTTEGKELAWRDSNGDPKNDHYMDKSHGTEIGSSSPFGDAEEDVVEEGEVMHNSQEQNKPEVGTSKVGDSQPFDGEKGKDIDEAVEDFDADDVEAADDLESADDDLEAADDDVEAADDDLEAADDDLEAADDELEDADDEHDLELDDDNDEYSDVEDEEIENRLSNIESMLDQIMNALNVDQAPVDEDNYDDDEDLFDDDEDEEYELEMDDDDDDDEVFESVNYKRAVARMLKEDGQRSIESQDRIPSGNMNRLDDFGKHPAYRKKVMTYPTTHFDEFDGYYDMNDDSVRNETPYGTNIGDGAPFEIDTDEIANSIAESIMRLKKK